MRELGKHFRVGSTVTVACQFGAYTNIDETRFLVNRVKRFDNEVFINKKSFWGTPLANHLYVERSEFDKYQREMKGHYGSVIILRGIVEQYVRYDASTNTHFRDYGLSNVKILAWIVKNKSSYTVYRYSKAYDRIFEDYVGTSWQDSYDRCLRSIR